MKNRGEKGSIVLLVSVSCLFILTVLVILFMNLQNKRQSQERQLDKITQEYEVTNQDMEQIYSEKTNN